MRALRIVALVTASCSALSAQSRGDLRDLRNAKWQKAAHGVHVASAGDMNGEVRYSALAGAPPKLAQLNALEDLPLPASLRATAFHVHGDGRISVRIPTAADERVYGYGLQFDRTMHVRRILELKVDHFNKGGGKTHAPVPFFVSSRGYGVLFNTARYLKVHNQVGNRKDSKRNPREVDRNPPPDEKQPGPWLAKPPGDAVEASLRGRGIELVAFVGSSLLDVVSRYNLFSGGGALPPLWGLGFWHRTPSKYGAAQVEKEIAEFATHDIPLDVIGLEPGWQTKSYPCTFEWQKKRFPDPRGFTQGLLGKGIRLNLWVNPYVSKQARIYDSLYPLAGSHLVWLGIVPDYTLPAAREVLLAQHKRDHFDIGISGYKIDEVDGYDHWLWPDHATFPSGIAADVMRQTYGMLMQRMLHKELFEANDRRTYGLVRATNGMASSYPFAVYSDSYGHGQYITGLSSASLCGVLWCPEIRSARSEREWINRMHTVCLSPLAMLNAWASGTKPWSYPNATAAVRRTIRLRMQLLPYLYTAFARYHFYGEPPVRSILLDEHGDGREDNSMFFFGADILVAPFRDAATRREVRLPPGRWFDYHTGHSVGSGQVTVTAEQTRDLPPMFVRDGAVIATLAKAVNRTRDARGGAIELRHYGARDGSCTLYEDDASTFAFANGEHAWRTIRVAGDTHAETRIGKPRLFGAARLRRMTRK